MAARRALFPAAAQPAHTVAHPLARTLSRAPLLRPLPALLRQITGRRAPQLGAGMVALLCAAAPGLVHAQYIADGGANETVPGTHASPWNVGGRLTVGNTGTATLTAAPGASITSTEGYVGTVAGSNGTVTLNGATWNGNNELFIGYQGTGVLNASAGAQLGSLIGRVGELAGSNGTVTLTGAGTAWSGNTGLQVGVAGTGVLNVSGGATASTVTGVIGTQAGGNGTVNVSGTGSAFNNSGGLFVGVNGQGALNVSAGGAATSSGATIGRYNGSVGTVTINGNGSSWNMGAGELRVGGDNTDPLTNPGGTGTLNIQTGAQVTNGAAFLGDNTGAAGTVNVSGTGAVWTVNGAATVGRTATGTVNVQTGAAMNVAGTRIGDQLGANGTVNVSGTGATLTDSARIGVGNFGTGALNISGGAVVGNTSAIIGWQDTGRGTLTVNGAGSQFNNSGVLYVGNVGQGSMTVTAGGLVTSTDGYVGAEANSGLLVSTATISGTGSRWTNSGDVFVGHNGRGVLEVNGGATVTSLQGILGDLAGAQGTLTLATGGSFTSTGDFNVGRFGTGTLTMSGGGQLSANRAYLGNEAGSTGTGTMSGTGTLWQTTGRVAIGGAGSGTLTVSSDAILRANEIAVGLAGGSTGVLNVGGAVLAAAAAAGQLDATTLRLGAGSATLNFNHTNTNYVLGANVIGNGAVNFAAGTTIFTGTNTYTGTTNIAGGATLQAGNGAAAGTLGAGAITNNGTLAFNRSDAYSVANVIGGTGALTQAGSGNLILTGVNTYGGATTVNAGTLSVNGSITSSSTVNSGAILGGTGTVGGVTVASGGILAPGNSIGNLTVNGPLVFNAGAIYRVETDAAGNADRTIVNGALTLNGTVDVRAGSGNYARNTSYTILTNTGAQTGTFAGVTSNLAFLTPTLSYTANSVVLNLATNGASYASVAQSGNQASVGNYLNGFAGTTGPLGDLVARIDGLSAAQARTAFDSLSGSQHAGSSQMAGAMGRNFMDALNSRVVNSGGNSGSGGSAGNSAGLNNLKYDFASSPARLAFSDAPAQLSGLFAGSGGASSLSGAPQGSAREIGRDNGRETGRAASGDAMTRGNWGANRVGQNGLWAQALGTGGKIRGDGNGAGSDYRGGGFLAGYDHVVSERWLIGAAGGYQRTSWDASTNGAAPASGRIETPQGALYARYTSGPWLFNLAGSYADHKFDTRRTVTIGALSSVASSVHHGREWGVTANAEYALAAGTWQLRPLAGLRYTHLREDGFTESGAALGANLAVNARTTQGTTVSAGLRALRPFSAASPADGGFEVRAIYSHLFGDNDSPLTARLGNTAASFTSRGTPLKRDAITVGAALSKTLARNFSGYLDASYEARGGGQNAYLIGAGMRYVW